MRYPLSISPKAGPEVMARFGLGAEAPTQLNPDVVDPIVDFVVTAHAPYSAGRYRLSIADVDDAVREDSIGQIAAYVAAAADRFPNLKKVNMHCSPKRWVYADRTLVGEYGRLIDAVRQLAAVAARHRLELVVENNRAYWEGVPEDVPADQVDRSVQNDYFGVAPGEWQQIQQDVDRSNVYLCLDPSHACTHAHTVVDLEKRRGVMRAYLEAGDALQHFHWNGNDLASNRGRQDTHMCIGTDTLPVDFHRAIKGWNATLLLEHFYSVEELERELTFIEGL